MAKPTIVTRAGKGSALTWTEGDANLTNLRDATITVTDGTNSKALDLNSTLTFTAGTNVTLSVNASTGAVTINSSQPTSVATLTTARAIYGNNFDGSAALTQIIASTYGGTGNGFTKFSGPTTAERTFTLPDANSTILVSGGALGTPSSGTVTNLTGTASININGTVGATTAAAGAFTTVSVTGVITSTQATGTAPFTIASTTNVANLNASSLNGATFAAPGAIGGTTASAGTFTALTATGTTTLATSLGGILKATAGVISAATAGTDYVAISGALGTPSSGTVTNLTGTASININGTVGATTQSSGAFTQLQAQGATNLPQLTLTGGSISSTAWTTAGIGIRANGGTFTDTSSTAGTVAASHIHAIAQPTMASTNAITITDAATFYVGNSPSASTNTTITNGWALLSDGPVKVNHNLRVKGLLEPIVDNGNSGAATLTPNAASGSVQKYTLTGNITLSAFGTPLAGQSLTLILVQDGTGSRILTSTMKWSGGTKTLSTAASSIDIVTIYYDGTTYYASLAKGFA